MPAFVVLSISLAVVILAVTVVVAFRLASVVRQGAAEVRARLERIAPLAEELGDELAVTQTELDRLQRRMDALRSSESRAGGHAEERHQG